MRGGGFDWKIIGKNENMNAQEIYAISSKDAYSFSGQKCSAQSMLFIHNSWDLGTFKEQLEYHASKEIMGPVVTLTSAKILDHVNQLLTIPGAKVWFGNKKRKIKKYLSIWDILNQLQYIFQ